jgi:hypothetical protein
VKARIISDELKVLDDEHAGHAEKLILDPLDGQTPAQLGRLAAQVVCTVDPDGAAKRRQYAEREEARVRFWRDNGGACALAAFGLPTDAALAANDAINDRAAGYKAAKIRPEARMDQLRVLAFLDLLNGITLQARIACDRAGSEDQAPASGPAASDRDGTGHDTAGCAQRGPANGRSSARPRDEATVHAGSGGHDTRGGGDGSGDDAGVGSTSDRDCDGSTSGDAGDGPGGSRPDDDGGAHAGDGGRDTGAGDVSTSDPSGADSGSDEAGGGSTNGHLGGGRPGAPAAAPVVPALATRAHLTLPLATLLGLADRPGAGHGLGPLDPALVRDLAAARSPHSQWCLTITDSQGTAVAHGCARPARGKRNRPASRDGPPR